ncbi:MAG: N-formylglutamate amidohydrolase [Pseudomonadota bacterium]
MITENDLPPLLQALDPPPFLCVRPDAGSRILLVCDHGGRRIPMRLDGLGLGERDLARHIAVDLGARDLTCALSEKLDATAIISQYSRLVMDMNRPVDDPTSIRAISDGIIIPGNCDVTEAERNQRCAALFQPYHEAITAALDARVEPVLISLHSFTRALEGGAARPWHVGLLSHDDRRLTDPALHALGRFLHADQIGDNQPYSGADSYNYTMHHHAGGRGLLNLTFEVRQDLLETAEAVERMATMVHAVILESLKKR